MTKKKKLPYFPLYPSDFLGDTGRLNAEKFGVYVRLLFNSWIEPLYDDIEELSEMVHASKEVTEKILTRYFELVDGAWRNARLERERIKAIKQHSKRVEAGRKGGNAKAMLEQSHSEGGSNGVATQNSELIPHNLELIKGIIAFLNEKAGKSFKYKTASNQSGINARLREGFTLEDFKTVITNKVNEWQDDNKMARFIRPATLFGTKFEGYLQESSKPVEKADPLPNWSRGER